MRSRGTMLKAQPKFQWTYKQLGGAEIEAGLGWSEWLSYPLIKGVQGSKTNGWFPRCLVTF